MSATTKRIPSLDGIRAVSIAMVIVWHYGRDAGLGDMLFVGPLGVRIFFIISGYLITGLLLKELEQDGRVNLLRFYFRRTIRIFPAFYFYLGCMLLISALGWAGLSFRQALPALTYTSNFCVPSLQSSVAHTWSLATEEQFYLIWPAALALAGRRRGLIVLLALLIIAPLSSHFLSLKFGYAVPAFFNGPIGIGCLLALTRGYLHKRPLYHRWVHSQVGMLLPVVILVSNLPALHIGGLRDTLSSLVLNVSIALWLDWAVVNADGFTGRLLNNRTIVFIGVLSYSLYLWQQPFTGLESANPALHLSGHWKLLVNPIARVAAIAICTVVSYYLVEHPMLRFRAWLEPKWFVNRKQSANLAAHRASDIQKVEA
jgi:peptidoglycan/LPS O-acetylase OafA/YrhL